MRHTLARLTGLLIAMMLVLTGCNLIGIDPMMQLDEDFAALKKQYSGVVASYDGGEITQENVMTSFASQFTYMRQLYSMYGLNVTNDMVADIQKFCVEDAMENVAIARQLETRGLALSEEKLAELDSETDEHYKEAYDSFYEGATGKTEEERAKRTEYNMASNGYTREGLYNVELAIANRELIEETVRGEITEVTDEELQTAYEEKLAADEEEYSGSTSAFETAMTSEDEIVCWIPEGYRTVKHILLKPESEVLSSVTSARDALSSAESDLESLREELDALNDDDAGESGEEADAGAEDAGESETEEAPRTEEEILADIANAEDSIEALKAEAEKAESDCLASVQDRIDEIYGRIEAGEDFDALMEEYGEDPGMQSEPAKSTGYYVSAASTRWDKNFTAGSMALQNVGDVSETPVISSSGVHIIRYESDVPAGAVALEDVKEDLYEDTLENMKDDHFASQLESWVAALNPQYSLDAFKISAE